MRDTCSAMSTSNRVRQLLREQKLTAVDLAKRMGQPAGTVRQHLNRGSIPASYLTQYARALGVSLEQLLGTAASTGMLALPPPRLVSPRAEPVMIAGLEYAPLPVMDISAAAGAGRLVPENADGEAVSHSVFRTSWLRGVTSAPLERLVVIRIAGDSMWPTLHHGDSVLVDTTISSIGRDGVYVIRLGDEVQCKRCSRHPVSGALTIASDNSAYPTYTDIQPNGLVVLGRVIWAGRTM